MAEKPVKIGIIGAGQIANSHLERYARIPEAEVVAVSDIVKEKAQETAARHGVPHVYEDPRQMLQREDIQAVDVCVHNNKHRPLTVLALEAGKDVYCEKPMAGSYLDALAMYEMAKKLGRKLAIQLGLVFHPETRAAKKLIDGGFLGELYHARSTGFRRRGRPFVDGYGNPAFVLKAISGGGALYDMGVYHISQILYLLGNPQVQRVSGKIYQKTDVDPERKARSGYNVEELGMGFVRFTGDLTMDIIESWAVHLDGFEGSSVVGTKGGVRLRPFGYYSTVCDMDMNSGVDLRSETFRWRTVHDEGDEWEHPQKHWVAVLRGETPLLPLAEIALNTMLISEGIYLSDRLGREVTADEVKESSVSTALTGDDVFRDDNELIAEFLQEK